MILQRIDVILRNGCFVTVTMWYYGIKVILKDQCDIIGSMWYYNVIYAITESVCYCTKWFEITNNSFIITTQPTFKNFELKIPFSCSIGQIKPFSN